MNTASAALGRTDRIRDALRALRSSSTEIVGAALVSAEGFTAASLLPEAVDEAVVGGMSAAFLSGAARIAQELLHAPLEQAFLKTGNGYIVINQVGGDAVLVVLTTENARVGLLLLEIKRHAQHLLRLL